MTTAVAASLGLTLGADYEPGEPFQAGATTLQTARFLRDPLMTTIKALDQTAALPGKAAFYAANNPFAPRWTYIAIPDELYLSLTHEQKKALIGWMYAREGGTEMAGLFKT